MKWAGSGVKGHWGKLLPWSFTEISFLEVYVLRICVLLLTHGASGFDI